MTVKMSGHGAHMVDRQFGWNVLRNRSWGRAMLTCEKDVRQIWLLRAAARVCS